MKTMKTIRKHSKFPVAAFKVLNCFYYGKWLNGPDKAKYTVQFSPVDVNFLKTTIWNSYKKPPFNINIWFLLAMLAYPFQVLFWTLVVLLFPLISFIFFPFFDFIDNIMKKAKGKGAIFDYIWLGITLFVYICGLYSIIKFIIDWV